MSTQRSVAGIFTGNGFHWVGDGFRVTQVFPGANDLGERMSPFLLMDYHAPYQYAPTESPRGVGVHPHRGFETVTIAFEGALAHHDSAGGGGVIHRGDAQWMTAASGILHKEYHEKNWASTGGTMHMMQLWVNLPAANKMDPPGYQSLEAKTMGSVELPNNAGTATVIAGELNGIVGPARTYSPINLWDVHLTANSSVDFSFPPSETLAVFVIDGRIEAAGTHADSQQLLLFNTDGSDVQLNSTSETRVVVLNGEPLNEPVVSYGPFVMNTVQQIRDAINDFNHGTFGQLG